MLAYLYNSREKHEGFVKRQVMRIDHHDSLDYEEDEKAKHCMYIELEHDEIEFLIEASRYETKDYI